MMTEQNFHLSSAKLYLLRKNLSKQSSASMYVRSLDKMDEIIGNYYVFKGRNDYNNKFKKFVDENGFDNDSLEDEFDCDDDPENCSYLGFDEEQTFPFHEPLKNESERDEKLYKFLKYCYENGRHPLSEAEAELIFDDELFSKKYDYNQCDRDFKHCDAVTRIIKILSYYDRLNIASNEQYQD
eukprot:495682_1